MSCAVISGTGSRKIRMAIDGAGVGMKRALTMLMLGFLIVGCTSKPVHNISQEYVPTMASGEQPSIERVERAILTATRKRGWSPRVQRPGLIEARLSVRAHWAAVEIAYSATDYSISYKDSANLGYKKGSIHRNYNNWVAKLSRTIQGELGVNYQRFSCWFWSNKKRRDCGVSY